MAKQCGQVCIVQLLCGALLCKNIGMCMQGFEIGSGFAGYRLQANEHNDEFYMAPDRQIRPRTNRYTATGLLTTLMHTVLGLYRHI